MMTGCGSENGPFIRIRVHARSQLCFVARNVVDISRHHLFEMVPDTEFWHVFECWYDDGSPVIIQEGIGNQHETLIQVFFL